MKKNFKDLTGQRFGRLIVLRPTEERKRKNIVYECQCDCGNIKKVVSFQLIQKQTKSCGCLKSEFFRKGNKRGDASFNDLYGLYRRNAKKRGLYLGITKKEFKGLTKQDCYYCGAKPSQSHQCTRCNGDYIYNGIDRIDSSKGYILENCVPCCGMCNKMKMDLSQEEFLMKIKEIYENRELRISGVHQWHVL